MSNRKINYNRPVPSSETIKDRQNFDDIISNVTVNPTPFFKSIGFWGAIGSSVIALTLLTYQFINSTKKNNAYEATPTLAVSSPELPADTKCLTPIHDDNDLAFEVFEIDPSKDNTIYVDGGAIIEIPANSFEMNKDDRVMKIEARVFRTKADAFVSGVPMDYNDQEAFESAGMIEIRGFQDGKEVDFAANGSVNVTLGLHKSPEAFNFYTLNDETGKWKTHPAIFQTNSEANELNTDEIKDQIEVTEEEIQTVRTNLEMLETPTKAEYHLAENEQKVFELKFNKHEFPELKSFERLQFEAKCSSIRYREILEKTWSGVELVQVSKGAYEAQFSNQRGDKTKVAVVPVLTGESAEVAYENYQRALKKVEKEERALKQRITELEKQNKARQLKIQGIVNEQEQAEVDYFEEKASRITEEMKAKRAMLNEFYNASAAFSANRWGVFNCDKPVKYPSAPVSPYTYASNNQAVDANLVFVFDLKKDVRYTFGHADHPLRDVAMNNNETVIVVQDRLGNMSYARVSGKNDETAQGRIELTPIDTKEADIDFFKSILDEKERVRA